MTPSVLLLALFAAAALVSLCVAKLMTKTKVTTQRFDGFRTWSVSDIPRVGGVAVFATIPLAGVAWVLAGRGGIPEIFGPLIIGAGLLFCVGLLDDLRGVRPLAKLVAQTVGALVIYYAGFRIQSLSFLPGHSFQLHWFSLPLTVLWVVGVSNALNLVDGMDGLAGGVSIIALIATAIAAAFFGNSAVPLYAVALIGGLTGFLRYNYPPARLFMGDSGSLVIGFFLAVLSVKGATDSGGVVHAFVPLFALAYVLLDTLAAIARRWLRGLPLSRPDARHIHNQLSALGLSTPRALAVVYGVSAALATLGLFATFASPRVTLFMTALGVAGLFAVMILGLYWLQYHEFFEVGSSITSGLRNTRSIIRDKINARDVTQTISCAKDFAEVQAVVAESAGIFRFTAMSLSDMRSRFVPAGVAPPQLSNDPAWRFEYPILTQHASKMNVYLTIWCSLTEKRKPAVAERIARIIAPTVATWLQIRDSAILEAAVQASAPIRAPLAAAASGRTRDLQRASVDLVV